MTFSSLGMNSSLMGSWTRQLVVVLNPSQGKGGQRLLSAQPPASVGSELRRVCLSEGEGEGERGGRRRGHKEVVLSSTGATERVSRGSLWQLWHWELREASRVLSALSFGGTAVPRCALAPGLQAAVGAASVCSLSWSTRAWRWGFWHVHCVRLGEGRVCLAPGKGPVPPQPHQARGRAGLSRLASPLPGCVDHGHAALLRAVCAPGPWRHTARRLQWHQCLPAHRLLPPERGHGQCSATTHPWARVGEGSPHQQQ